MCGACDNGLSRRAFLKGFAGTAASLPLAGCQPSDLDWLVDLLVSKEFEAELGRQSFQQITARLPVLNDPNAQRHVARIGERIVGASGSVWRDWRFVVFATEEVNAFALPGGRVGVHAGMLRVAQDEAQLATVLGHEVAHVEARHGAQRILSEQGLTLVLRLVASLVSEELNVSPELIAALGGGLADIGVLRPFSRAQELEADALGVRYMEAAGFPAQAALTFWTRMQRLAGDGGVPALLSTHPSSAARIEQLRELIGGPALPPRAS